MADPMRNEGVEDSHKESPEKPWAKSIETGHCFVWFDRDRTTLYSTVLSPEVGKEQPGYYWTKTFCQSSPTGFVTYVRDDLPAKLLSEEQMNVAKSLGWPNDTEGLLKVLGVPSS